MKKLGIGIALLIIIVIGAILVVPGFLNWNEYKDQIEKTASDYTGREVKINGDISLTLLPTSALSVKNVTVANLDGGQADHMLSLKSLDVKVSFPSLISSLFGGQAKVEKFILVGPVIALEILEDGQVNWDFTSAKPDKPGQDEAFSTDIRLDKFQIIDGQVSYEDKASSQMELLRKINANVRIKSVSGPFELEGSAKYKGLEGELDLKLGKHRPGKKTPLSFTITAPDHQVTANILGGVIFSDKDSAFAGKMTIEARDAGDLLAVKDSLKGVKSANGIKVGQDFQFETTIDAIAEKIQITDLTFSMGQSRGQGAAEISLNENINIMASLSLNKLDLDPLMDIFAAATEGEAPASDNSTGTDDYLKKISGKLDIKLGALKYNSKIASQINVALLAKDGVVDISTLRARMPGGSAVSFTGQVISPGENDSRTTLTGDLSLNASNLRGLLSWLKLDVAHIASGQLAQFSYKSGLKMTSDLLQIYSIDGRLDALSFTGGLSYALRGRPSYGVSLDIRNFNLDSYLGKKEAASENSWEDSLEMLNDFDAKYDIGLTNFTMGGVKIRAGHMSGLLLGGKLTANAIKLEDAAGINMNASGTVENLSDNPKIAAIISAEAKSLSTLKRALKLDNGIDFRRLGKVKLEGSISSTFEQMDVDVSSRIGVSQFDVTGMIRSATLKKFPQIGSTDLQIESRSPGFAVLIDQFDLPLTRPRAQDDRQVRFKGRIKTSSDLMDIDGKFNIAGGEVILKGRRKGKGDNSSLDMAVDIKGAQTSEFLRGLGVDFQPSASNLGAISLKSKLQGKGDHYTFSNLVGDVGPVKLSGSGKLDMAAEKPIFDFNLKAGEIPLHDFMAAKGRKLQGKAKKHGQWTREKMDLSLLSTFEGRANISAASLRYNDYIFENPTFLATLQDGTLSISDFTGRLFGGNVALSGIFGGQNKNKGTPKMSMNMTLKKASLSQATKSAAGIAPVTGFFDLTGHFTGEGISQYDMMSSLSGDGDITASPGLVSGIDIPVLSNKLAELDSNKALLGLLGTALTGGETSYKGGVSKIAAKDGKISFSPVDIELEGAKTKMNMALDLLNWTLRSSGRLSLTDHPNAPPIEVSIAGDVSNPVVNFGTERLKKYVGAKIASNMLQNLIGGEGGLEGIFGPKKQNTGEQPPTAEPKAEITPQKTPAKPAETNPKEDFGKRLLEKLFKKEKEKPAPNDVPQ